MIRSARKKVVPLDDATSVAGWVFADLLLLLSIIFLTSISFAVPSSSEESSLGVDNSAGVVSALPIDEGFTMNPLTDGFNFFYTEFDRDKLNQDLRNYFETRGLPANTDVIYAQLVGGYIEGVEGSDSGTMAALKYSIELAKADISAFEKASIDLLTSNRIPSGVVALRLTFAPPLEFKE